MHVVFNCVMLCQYRMKVGLDDMKILGFHVCVVNLFCDIRNQGTENVLNLLTLMLQMIDDQDLGFFANFLGVFIFVLVIAYHFVMADPKFEGN
ncbi:hypothetical protein Fmac_006245 [Flemingia macrophylla]|uniref:Dolichyl-diphosphooligosaccharide--protein glycosyltransferase subunit 4 n=1 Tax=Flemingia macrophylla TaxID=520843 RepID=A0ABD1NCU4_9FABA